MPGSAVDGGEVLVAQAVVADAVELRALGHVVAPYASPRPRCQSPYDAPAPAGAGEDQATSSTATARVTASRPGW